MEQILKNRAYDITLGNAHAKKNSSPGPRIGRAVRTLSDLLMEPT